LKLQTVIESTGTAFSYTLPASAAAMIDGEVLYTVGGALSQAWPVPCRAVGQWRNRVFLAEDEWLWFSKEMEEGFGPLFNEVQRAHWGDASSAIHAMGPVNHDYFAIIASDNIGVLSGPGPDGVGNGNYTIQTISTRLGVSDGGHALMGPAGLFFQDRSTGRIQCIMPDLVVRDAAGGAWNYANDVITSAAWDDKRGLLIFSVKASNSAIVIDYEQPRDSAPLGQVYRWTFQAAQSACASTLDSTGMLFLGTDGAIFRPGTGFVDGKSVGSDTYQMKLTTSWLQVGDIQGEFSLEVAQILMTIRALTGVTLTTHPAYAEPGTADPRITSKSIVLAAPTYAGGTESIRHRPPYCARIQGVAFTILEAAGITNQSFEFEGFGIEYTAPGKMLRPAETRII
jgi:hypothetical protein